MSDAEVQIWAAYLAKEPAPEEKIEVQLANLAATYVNSKSKGSKRKTMDFMFFRNAWKFVHKSSGDEAVDHDIKTLMGAFASRLVIANPA
jgi:hypothetical protein